MRSHVVFKLLNYVTENRQSSAYNISAYVNVCKLSVRERESMCFQYIINVILWQKLGYDLSFLSFCSLYLFVWHVVVGFGSFAVLGCKDL